MGLGAPPQAAPLRRVAAALGDEVPIDRRGEVAKLCLAGRSDLSLDRVIDAVYGPVSLKKARSDTLASMSGQTGTSPDDASPKVRRGPGRPPGSRNVTEETRARIKNAAIELFAEKGYSGAGVAEIGNRAGVQRGALYHHIGSKEHLLWEIVSDHATASLEGLLIVESDLPPLEKLRALIRHQVEFVVARRREMAIYTRGEQLAQCGTSGDARRHAQRDRGPMAQGRSRRARGGRVRQR
jgi:AcrR family transcriptional regulator